MDWENAFFEQYQDACVGRLLRGLVHNLNGVNQAFSLQAALFRSMFLQAETLLREAENICPQANCGLMALREILRKREVMVGQMEEKVERSQRIVARVAPLSELYGDERRLAVPLGSIIAMEMEILEADNFFKHSVEKQVVIPSELPPIRQHSLELHTICFVLLDNATHALRETDSPVCHVQAEQTEDSLRILVRDTGSGIEPESQARIFEPFFSTREGALGIGLYLANKMVDAIGGSIGCSSRPGDTCFTVTVPLHRVV